MKTIVMPAAGQTTDAATVTRLLVSVGDKVKRGDKLLEVETDKATLPIESIATGVVCAILVNEFDRIDAGSKLLCIGSEAEFAAGVTDVATENGADITAKDKTGAALPDNSDDDDNDDFAPVNPERAGKTDGGKESKTALPGLRDGAVKGTYGSAAATPAMPNAKAEAKKRGVDLCSLTPSNGVFIRRADVIAAAASAANTAVNTNASAVSAFAPATDRIPVAVMRDTLSARTERGAVPQECVTVTADATSLSALIEKAKRLNGNDIRPGDVVMLALARLSELFPQLRVRYEGGVRRLSDGCDFGLAYSGENGCVPATVAGVDKKTLAAISRENAANPLALARGDMSVVGRPSLTVFDMSGSDILSFTPVVTGPEVASVSVGGMRPAPAVMPDGSVCARMSVTLTFAYDCRVITPTEACSVASRLAALLADPALML